MNKILILGTFHMEGSSDIYGQKQEGIAREYIQIQIEEVVEKIKRFNPTKIAIEMEKKYQSKLQDKYNEYINNSLLPGENEIYKIAFPLAKQLGHQSIFCIEWKEDGVSQRGCGDVYEFLKSNETKLFEEIEVYRDAPISINNPILNIFKEINSEKYIENTKAYYTNYSRIGIEENYYGLGWLLWWYQRNLIIFANISTLVNKSSDERILLLIGAAHKGILEQMFSDSKLFEIVDSLDYLD